MSPKTNTDISGRIARLVANGLSPMDALRTVCGRETVDAMIDDLYHTLRGEQPDPFARLVALGLAQEVR